jgi:hypothetical protein
MKLEIVGTNLPGRRCQPGPDGEIYDNIHVGLGIHREPFEIVPGNAKSARWQIEIDPKRAADGSLDFRGRFVHGTVGDRFLYLNWGTVAEDGAFHLFRRAKLPLSEIDPTLVEQAIQAGSALIATVNLTDRKGHPVCARVRPPAISWQVVE